MVTCARCSSPADETQRTTCPNCFAPLIGLTLFSSMHSQSSPISSGLLPSGPAMPNTNKSLHASLGLDLDFSSGINQHSNTGASGNNALPSVHSPFPLSQSSQMPVNNPPVARTSLTGEVYQSSQPGYSSTFGVPTTGAGQNPHTQNPRYGLNSGYGAANSGGNLPPLPSYISASTAIHQPLGAYIPPRAAKSQNANPIFWIAGIAGVIVVVFIFGVAAGVVKMSGSSPFSSGIGSRNSNPEAAKLGDPRTATQALLETLRMQNWHQFYYLCVFERGEEKSARAASEFDGELRKYVSSNSHSIEISRVFSAMTEIQIGAPSISGNSATVPTSWECHIDGETIALSGSAHLIKENGLWGLDELSGEGHEEGWAMAELIGHVKSRSGNAPDFVVPSFGPVGLRFGPGHPIVTHPVPGYRNPGINDPGVPNYPSPPTYSPPVVVHPPNFGPNIQPGNDGSQPNYIPRFTPRLGHGSSNPNFGPRFGPRASPNFGPRFGPGASPNTAPRNFPSAPSGGAPSSGGGGFSPGSGGSPPGVEQGGNGNSSANPPPEPQ